MRTLLTLTALSFLVGCIADTRGPHVEYAELAAVKADATPEERVAAAGKALSVNFIEVIETDENGAVWILDPVGIPPVVAQKQAWWFEDVAPLVGEGTEARKDIERHVAARTEAIEYDRLYDVGSAVVYGGAAVSVAGLGWLLFANGGDPAFYTTLAAALTTTVGGTSAFATWYLLQLPGSVEARKAKIDLMEDWNDGVAKRYGVGVTPGEKPGTVNITAAPAP